MKNAQVQIIQPRLLNRESMALCLCISEDSLDKLRKMGLPCITLPGTSKILFDPDDVVAWIKEHSRPELSRTEKEASEQLEKALQN